MASKSAKKSPAKPKTKATVRSRAKSIAKHASKKVLTGKPAAKSLHELKASAKTLSNEILEWVKENHGQETARAAVEKFGVSYAHVSDWLKKEGMQVREAVETLIESRKKTAIKKGGSRLKELTVAIEKKKSELEKLTRQLSNAYRNGSKSAR